MFQNSMKQRMNWEDFYGPNLGYALELYDQYTQDPNSIDPDLKEMFDELGAPPSDIKEASGTKEKGRVTADLIQKIASAVRLAEDIRTYGHLNASVNPLRKDEKKSELFPLSDYGLTEEEIKAIPASVICKDAPKNISNGLEAIQYLRNTYKRTISFEFDHVHDFKEREWLTRKIESGELFQKNSAEKLSAVLERLTEVEGFEQFLHRTFVGQKRFSIEGLDALVPVLDDIIAQSVKSGTTSVNIGMAHRGRLNVLAHVLGKPYEIIFSEFQHAPKSLVPSEDPLESATDGRGMSNTIWGRIGSFKTLKQNQRALPLANNPSHLEFINPIVEGSTRAAQETRTQSGYPVQDETKSLAILIHGDAAFPGEGIVAETLNLSSLKGYQVGGAIHIIANNMIGFTTESAESRSTKYASDLAKGYEIPIVHVNADDPEACLSAVKFAVEYRKTFNKDFLIDLIGYRRYGHNEMDEPSTTQPMLYDAVRKHPTSNKFSLKKLVKEGVVTEEVVQNIEKSVTKRIEDAIQKVPSKKEHTACEIELPEPVSNGFPDVDTSIDFDVLRKLNGELINWRVI
ncbi:2-oxoglutarate dehydrogenase E1 component [Bacillus subtilis]|uniref:2-oxoglutarate dehydrogenase E1 component n=1 Tax=Bacillus subtilis TaxID=1423 RepID=UPI0003132E4F|nr:2-oxoglutarate dehydrogenase E1 component [Bacillus subtilis]